MIIQPKNQSLFKILCLAKFEMMIRYFSEVKLAQIEFKSDTINYMIFREDSWKGIVYSCIRSRCSNGTSAIYCAIGFVMSDNFTYLDTKRVDIP